MSDRDNAWNDLGGRAAPPPPSRTDRYGCIDKSAPDPEPYPADWTAQQRVSAYWAQLRNKTVPSPQVNGDALPWFDPFSMPPCPDCGSTRSCLCHEYDRPPRHPNDELPVASPEHIRRCRAWLAQHQAAKHGDPIPPVESAGLSPLTVACPHCKASVGERCINPRPGNAREPFKGLAHPSRLEAVGIDDKAQAGARQALIDRMRGAGSAEYYRGQPWSAPEPATVAAQVPAEGPAALDAGH